MDQKQARLRRCWLAFTPILIGVVMMTGCSRFNRDWKKAAGVPSTEIEGRWQGTWKSDVNGHTDRLRCLVESAGEGKYLARFHAKYQKIFSFSYAVPLEVRREPASFKFVGDADLGWYAGGVYHYEGEANGTNFTSTYRCPKDHGVFQMFRPPSLN